MLVYQRVTNDHGDSTAPSLGWGFTNMGPWSPMWRCGDVAMWHTARRHQAAGENQPESARRCTMISWFMVYLGLWWVYHCQLGGIMRHHKPQLA